MDEDYKSKLIEEFRQAALFLLRHVENENWKWSDNYLREHVRCAHWERFTNTISPDILRLMRQRYPGLAKRIEEARKKQKA
jgi:hypothetical protein